MGTNGADRLNTTAASGVFLCRRADVHMLIYQQARWRCGSTTIILMLHRLLPRECHGVLLVLLACGFPPEKRIKSCCRN